MSTITKLLIANRGEIASRVIRTARDMDIATVAVYSDADADSPFVREADEAVRLPGTAPADTYLRGDLIVEAAQRTGADAVHPGYGFLSENADFARACADAGVIFVGPSPEAIAAWARRSRPRSIMARPGSRCCRASVVDDATSDERSGDGCGRLQTRSATRSWSRPRSAAAGAACASSATADELVEAVAGARREAQSAFGNGTVFLERYVDSPRHIEVQIFGDTQGNVVHLFERECSIQRRYQKIVEEAPSPVVDDELREELGPPPSPPARRSGTSAQARSSSCWAPTAASTSSRSTPVSRSSTRSPSWSPGSTWSGCSSSSPRASRSPTRSHRRTVTGHAIEVRLYAEDVAAGFLPATGTLHGFEVPTSPASGSTPASSRVQVSTHYDPMLAKVIAYGPTRDDARRPSRAP